MRHCSALRSGCCHGLPHPNPLPDDPQAPRVSLALVQQKLRAAGFDPGPVDGQWGPRTAAALDSVIAAATVGRKGALTPAADVLANAIVPALALLPTGMDTQPARVLMLAISGQEADFHHRWQVFDRARPEAMGAARGLWQFERGGGVRGVLTHERSRALAIRVCEARGVVTDVYGALHRDDVLAGAFARLLLWTSPRPLPAIGDVEGAWQMYLREWRPGAYTNGSAAQRDALRRKWSGYYAEAMKTVVGA